MKKCIVATCILLVMLLQPAQAKREQTFAAWLAGFKQEAVAAGIDPELLETAFFGIRPNRKVIKLDRKQPENTKTLRQYLSGVLSSARTRKGRELAAEHAALLQEVSRKYRVQPEYIIALWGIETSFGENTGGFDVIEALATLAYDGRRSRYFRKELLHALQIADQGHIEADAMVGSWAGAMGQCQFMPSSFLRFAVDKNGDGKKDIWYSTEDVFASIAFYLQEHNWNGKIGWGAKANLPDGGMEKIAGLNQKKSISEWASVGVTPATTIQGTDQSTPLMLITAEKKGQQGGHYLVTENFEHLLKWNRSRYFAIAVGTLADSIQMQESK